jgi:hypothetical protein
MLNKELQGLLYHGSYVEVSEVELLKCAPKKDFGIGFYTTISQKQAEKFAKIKSAREKKAWGFVSVFEFLGDTDLKVKKFDSANIEWLNFVLENRGFVDKTSKNEYDIIIGAVADDAVGLVLNQLVIGTYGDPTSEAAKETAIRLLETENLYNQVLLRTKKAVNSLKFKEAYRVKIN